MILELLAVSIDGILDRITTSHLRSYDYLQRYLGSTDVASDRSFQRTFNGYYRMQRRPKAWYTFYFSFLEREKNNQSITFQQVLKTIYSEMHRVEPAFSSKLVATIRPEMPVYDQWVRKNLSLKEPGKHKPAEVRVKELMTLYSTLEGKVAALVLDRAFTDVLRPAFEKSFRRVHTSPTSRSSTFCSGSIARWRLTLRQRQRRSLTARIPDRVAQASRCCKPQADRHLTEGMRLSEYG